MQLDRRQWLTSFGLTLSGLGMTGAPGGATLATSEPAAPGMTRLDLNENPFGPAPGVAAALERERPNLCRYTTDAELNALISIIAAKERVAREQVVLGEILEPLGIELALSGGPGGEFVYSDPGYTALTDAAVSVGGRAVAVPLNASLANDFPLLAQHVNERTRALSLVNPHNPTGIVTDAADLKAFASTLARRTLVIVDEAYLEFADNFAERTLVGLVRDGHNVAVFRTLAKAYGLAGMDIGYGIVPMALARALIAKGANNPHLFNRLAVSAATASLPDADYVMRIRRQVAAERQKWVELFAELSLRHTPSSANFVFFETGRAHGEFAHALLSEGILIGRVFPPYEQWARISIGLPPENARARAAVRRALGRR